MQSRWNEKEAARFAGDPLSLRVYSSRLLGSDPSLVLHGGGNTSVKATAQDIFGDDEEVLYVKGSGWDLATIEAPGFAPVRLGALQRMATLEELSDSEMVTAQRAAMTDPYAPNPSVEAILHAIIPYRFVDHSHADAVVALTNTPDGEAIVRDLYGPEMMIVPYVMPGFVLARAIYEMTRDTDWDSLPGMILLNHGVFTFAEGARESYERHIEIVTAAEEYIEEKAGNRFEVRRSDRGSIAAPLEELAWLRKAVSGARGQAVLASVDQGAATREFSELSEAPELATRGLLTPDHVLRTKRIPLVVTGEGAEQDVGEYVSAYGDYFDRHKDGSLSRLDPAPRWALWPGVGSVAFGGTPKEIAAIDDIRRHTLRAIGWSEALGGWQPLGESEIFAIEYWELEQAKLKGAGAPPPLQGKVVLVTGGASGIGRACVEAFLGQGAVVAALDISTRVTEQFEPESVLGIRCDVTDEDGLKASVDQVVSRWGGLDVLVCNAGIFPASQALADMDGDHWDRSIEVNLTSQQRLLQACAPYLKLGCDPTVVIIGSKNAPAPGPGAGAYSVAKAGLTQLARVAALELAGDGIRVNVLHPNAVFDTALWSAELLEERAASYGISVDEYRANNLLGVEITSADVAALACAVAGPVFAKTTGAQIPVDGGNERVI
ncbi:MAG: bifunctional aldolase/short-chain dehydrogenase [Caldilineaceae bacterium SB0668_bin_21]|nr:bifunctional aldolase/short-chain dehydrogenase [Caldilineaceae bacterium SB0668_bin_21]MYC20188.1 bifunctional aldolase/short-chain dehydrogenase [Caldilineaceae bacterium SB0662_bin_25]